MKTFEQSDMLALSKRVNGSALVRENMHADRSDRLHEMFIAFGNKAEPTAHRHTGKDESLLCLTGAAKVHFYGIGCATLSEYGAGGNFYCRIPAMVDHRVFPLADGLMIRESVPGPWYPEETEPIHANELAEEIIENQNNPAPEISFLRMARVSEEAVQASAGIVTVGKREIDILKAEVNATSRKRIRLCTHENVANRLHEMFIVYTDQTYVQPHKHLAKDESFHVLEGLCDLIFYTDSGDVTEIVQMGPKSSGLPFYTRIPADVYHTMVMRSEMLVFQCSTPGPFVRDHTKWAAWGKHA